MECAVTWTGAIGISSKMGLLAESGSGHALVMDGSPEGGGANLGPRPMEMLLLGMGGCSTYDVVQILQRGRHAITGCTVQIKAERATTDPKVFTTIHMHYVVSGRALNVQAVERAIALSHDKYCSASIMLGAVAKLSSDFEIKESA